MHKFWQYSSGAYLRDHRYLVRPAVLEYGHLPEDYTALLRDDEIEQILKTPVKSICCPLHIAFLMRLKEGEKTSSSFLLTRDFVKMALVDYANFKGFSISIESDEIILNPFFDVGA